MINLGRPWGRGPLITRWLTISGACLIVVTILTTVQVGSFQEAVADVADDFSMPRRADAFDPAAPNIYVVLLDGYPGDDAASLDPTFDSGGVTYGPRGARIQRPASLPLELPPTRLTLATMFGATHIRDAEFAAVALQEPRG